MYIFTESQSHRTTIWRRKKLNRKCKNIQKRNKQQLHEQSNYTSQQVIGKSTKEFTHKKIEIKKELIKVKARSEKKTRTEKLDEQKVEIERPCGHS